MFVFGKKREDEDINVIVLDEPEDKESDALGEDKITFSNRLTGIENRLAKIDASIILFRNEKDQLAERIDKVEKDLQDVLLMYEVISNQVNPFLDSKSTGGIGMVEDKFKEIDDGMDQLRDDLMLLISMQIDLDRIIDETIMGEVI
jgi:flagellar protein FlaC